MARLGYHHDGDGARHQRQSLGGNGGLGNGGSAAIPASAAWPVSANTSRLWRLNVTTGGDYHAYGLWARASVRRGRGQRYQLGLFWPGASGGDASDGGKFRLTQSAGNDNRHQQPLQKRHLAQSIGGAAAAAAVASALVISAAGAAGGNGGMVRPSKERR